MEVFGKYMESIELLMGVMIILIAAIALIGNAYVILLYFSTNQLKDKKRNLFLISLAFANVLTSVIAIPLSFLVSYNTYFI